MMLNVEQLAEAILRHDANDSWTMGEQLAHDRGRCGNRKCATTIAAEYARLGVVGANPNDDENLVEPPSPKIWEGLPATRLDRSE